MDILQYCSAIEVADGVNTLEFNSHSNLPLDSSGSLIQLMHLNIRSINKNFDNFMVLLESLKQKLDLIILTETWNISNLDLYSIPGYNSFYSHGKYNQNDGVVVFVRDGINATFKNIIFTQNTFTILNFEINSIPFCIVSAYRLPSTGSVQFVGELQNILESFDRNKVCVFTGDINIDILDTQNGVTSEYLNIMADNGYLSYINKPTRVTLTSQTTVDHIFVRKPLKYNLLFTPIVLQCDITDHFAVMLEINLKIPSGGIDARSNQSPQYLTTLDYNKLKHSLLSETWNNIYKESNPNVAYDCFIQTFEHHISLSKRITTVNSVNRKIKPWITKGLVQSIRTRDKLKTMVLKNKTDLELFQQYKIYRNKLNSLLKVTKACYLKKKMSTEAIQRKLGRL